MFYQSSLIYKNTKIFFKFFKDKNRNNLNQIGNFFKFVHQQKKIQKFLIHYCDMYGIPESGKKIYLDSQSYSILIIKTINNYELTEGERKIKQIESKI